MGLGLGLANPKPKAVMASALTKVRKSAATMARIDTSRRRRMGSTCA